MKNRFSTVNCRKSCQRSTEIFLFSKYPCTTVTVELELDVSVCAQLKFLPTKTASHGLILEKLCILGTITCHRLALKGKFFASQEKGQGKAKNSVVINLNVSADDINTFKV